MSQYDRKAISRSLRAKNDHEWIERELIQAYIKLELMAPDDYGCRTVAVGPFGGIEVQLIDLPRERAPPSTPPLWLEVFSCHDGSPIDSYGCFVLGERELAAAIEMISDARRYVETHD
jgi:hypothetical protein